MPMTITPDQVSAYFTPLDYILYMIVILVGLVAYYQWRWTDTCRHYVQVLVVRGDGHGDYELAPQDGGSVTLRNPKTDVTRVWPINELATIDVPYPSGGFVPPFLRKSIRMVAVDEKDWEPILNRGGYRKRVASPDIVEFLNTLAEANPDLKIQIEGITDEITTLPTKEIIASPQVLGNLIHEKISQMLATVNKEVLDSVSTLVERLNKTLSPTTFYIGIGILLAALLFVAYQLITTMGTIVTDVAAIKAVLGIP